MNKILNNIIIVSIFILPMASIIPIHGTIVWYPQLLALMALGLICLALLLWDMNKFISLLLIYATFSYIFVCSQSPRSMLCLITGYSGILFSYFVSKSTSSNIYKALAIISILNFIYLIFQIFKLDPIFIPSSNWLLDRTVGFMGSRNQLGIFSACVSTILIYISPWFIILGLPILLIKCSTALVGLYSGLNLLLFIKGFKKIAIVTFLILLIGSFLWVKFGSKSGEIKERLRLWNLTISQMVNGNLISDDSKNIIKSNPLFGYGIGNFFVFSPHSQKIIVSKGMTYRYEHAHNDLIEAFFEFGYVGMILISLCIFGVIGDFITHLHIGHPNTSGLIVTFCSLVTLSVCSMGVYVFHAPVSLFLFCLTLGLFYREVNYAKQIQIA